MRSHNEISNPHTKSMKIPLGKLIPKMRSPKHEVAYGSGKKRRQSSFTFNARKKKKAEEP
jgi:hypothetical protein